MRPLQQRNALVSAATATASGLFSITERRRMEAGQPQRRFFAVGGRSTRAGAGRTHSKMSVKQVSSIPKGPGRPGRAQAEEADPARRPLFVPLSRITQPQPRIVSPSGTWRPIDTSFSDLTGTDDRRPTTLDDAEAVGLTAGEIADQLAEVCKGYYLMDHEGFVTSSDPLDLNSGPTYEDTDRRSKRRRLWFALVRNFYEWRGGLWAGDEVTADDLPKALNLLEWLLAADGMRITAPETWEDEPPECFKPLPVEGLARAVARAVQRFGVAAAVGPTDAGLDACVSLLTVQLRYPTIVSYAPLPDAGDVDPSKKVANAQSESIRLLFDALASHRLLDTRRGLAFIRVLCCSQNQINIDPTDEVIAAVADAMAGGASNGTVTASTPSSAERFLLAVSAHHQQRDLFDHFDLGEMKLFYIAAAGAERCRRLATADVGASTTASSPTSSSYSFSSSVAPRSFTLERVLTMAMNRTSALCSGTVHRASLRGGDDPVATFDKGLRLAHPDIHPHARVRHVLREGERELRPSKMSVQPLLAAVQAFRREVNTNNNCDATATVVTSSITTLDAQVQRTATLEQRLVSVSRHLEQQRDGTMGPTNYTALLQAAAAARRSQSTSGGGKIMGPFSITNNNSTAEVATLLLGADTAIGREQLIASPVAVVGLLEAFAAHRYRPQNLPRLEVALLRCCNDPAMSGALASRAAVALATIGRGSATTFALLCTALLRLHADTSLHMIEGGDHDERYSNSVTEALCDGIALVDAAQQALDQASATAIAARVFDAFPVLVRQRDGPVSDGNASMDVPPPVDGEAAMQLAQVVASLPDHPMVDGADNAADEDAAPTRQKHCRVGIRALCHGLTGLCSTTSAAVISTHHIVAAATTAELLLQSLTKSDEKGEEGAAGKSKDSHSEQPSLVSALRSALHAAAQRARVQSTASLDVIALTRAALAIEHTFNTANESKLVIPPAAAVVGGDAVKRLCQLTASITATYHASVQQLAAEDVYVDALIAAKIIIDDAVTRATMGSSVVQVEHSNSQQGLLLDAAIRVFVAAAGAMSEGTAMAEHKPFSNALRAVEQSLQSSSILWSRAEEQFAVSEAASL